MLDKVMARTCKNLNTVQHDILRVNYDLDKTNLFSWELYLTKILINPCYPYSKIALGSLKSLKKVPEIVWINVLKKLYKFYQERYRVN